VTFDLQILIHIETSSNFSDSPFDYRLWNWLQTLSSFINWISV